MRVSDSWSDYELIECTSGYRLERWKDIILIRPDPQVIWNTEKKSDLWNKAHAKYIRSKSGGGNWEVYKKIPDAWQIRYKELLFNVKPMGFKHTGIFPEQATNWDYASDVISKSDKQMNILNLFGYTGCATLACLEAGAKVCHVDASKGMVNWAKENQNISKLSDKPVRWLVDDCIKFVQREIRRGNTYDGIILDPPSYGRGPGGEVWKLEEQIYSFVDLLSNLLTNDSKFVILNSYTTGLSPSVMSYILNSIIVPKFGGRVTCDDIGLKVTSANLVLPCGSTAIWGK